MKKLFESMSSLKDSRNGKVVTFDFDNTIVKSFYNKSANGEEIYQFGGVNKEIIKRIGFDTLIFLLFDVGDLS